MKIKQLEWESDCWGNCGANPLYRCIKYVIGKCNFNSDFNYRVSFMAEFHFEEIGYFDNIEESKESAQNHFERLIRKFIDD